MKRKIAAILAADAAEYSRLVAEDEEGTLRQLVASIGVFKASVEAHGGRIFNTAGDAVLAEFQSAVEAVRSAVDIQDTLSARNEVCAPGRRLMFRMGISIGDVVENEGDLLGDGVNIAARLQSLSQPGGLAVSKWVQEQVAGKVTTEFRDTGFQHVKNMPGPIHVFQSRIAAVAAPADTKVDRAAVVAASAGRRRFGSVTVGLAAALVIVVGALFFVLTRPDPGAVVTREITPIVARQESPLPAPEPLGPQKFENASPGEMIAPKIEPASVETPAAREPIEAALSPAPAASAPEGPKEAALPLAPAASAPEEPREAALPLAPAASAPDEPKEAALPAAPASSAPEGLKEAILPVAPPASAPQEQREAALPPVPAASAPQTDPAPTLQPERLPEASAAPAPAPVFAAETPADRKRLKVQCAEVLERAQLGDLTSDDRAFLRSKCR